MTTNTYRAGARVARPKGKKEDAILYHRDIRERERRAADLEAFAEARRRCVERADEIAGPGFSDRSWGEAMEAFWTPEGEGA